MILALFYFVSLRLVLIFLHRQYTLKVFTRHDWPDTECVLILKNIRKAMKPGSRVIIRSYYLPYHIVNTRSWHRFQPDDTVLREAVCIPNQSEPKILLDGDTATQQSLQLDVAPEPLLPNYGVGCIRTYKVDITMLALMNAKARTLSEYIELGWVLHTQLWTVWHIHWLSLVNQWQEQSPIREVV